MGFIQEQFPNIPLLDTFDMRSSYPSAKSSIYYIEDQSFYPDYHKVLSFLDPSDNNFLITEDPAHHDYLVKQGFTSYCEPFWYPVDDALSFKEIVSTVNYRNKFLDEYNFICLNRNPGFHRVRIVEKLADYNLLTQGFVTAHFKDLPECREHFEDIKYKDLSVDDLSHYVTTMSSGFERHNHIINGVPCSTNVKNFVHISESMTGHTVISSETEYNNAIADKSFMFAFCKKMPITFGKFPIIDMLREEGFDCFDDVIDQSYTKLNWELQVEQGIDHNINLLNNSMASMEKEINERTDNNLDFLLGPWLQRRLDKLTEAIYNWNKGK